MNEKLTKEHKVVHIQPLAKEKYEPLELKVLDVKSEKGYATSAGGTSSIAAPQWTDSNW